MSETGAVAAEARALRLRAERDLDRLRKLLAEREDRHPAVIEALPLVAALVLHSRFARAAAQLQIVARDAATGGPPHRCFACRLPWTAERSPVVFVAITYLEVDAAFCCGLCGDCALKPDLRDRVLGAAERDLGLDRASARHVMGSPGHA